MNRDRPLTRDGLWNPPASSPWAVTAKQKRHINLKAWKAKRGRRNKWAPPKRPTKSEKFL